MPTPAVTQLSKTEPLAETEATPSPQFECDHCGRRCNGTPGGAGLLVWTRGEEVRLEEPPLCDSCASRISIGAWFRWSVDSEGEG